MKQKFPTLHSTLIVTLGNVVLKAIAFISSVILIKSFLPSDYGVIVTFLAIISTIPVLMDFGTSVSIIRFLPALEASSDALSKIKILKAIFKLRLISGLIWFFVGFACSRFLAEMIFHKSSYSSYIIIGLFGAVFVSFFQYILTILQVQQKYITMVIIQVSDNICKLMLIFILVYPKFGISASPIFVSLIYAVVPLLTIFFVLFLKTDLLQYFKMNLRYKDAPLKILWEFSFWYMISSISIMIFMNFDIYILAVLKSTEEVGYFGAAYKLASLLWIIVHALNTVLLPAIGRKKGKAELLNFVKKSAQLCILLSIIVIPVTMAAPIIINTFCGVSYNPSIKIFQIIAWDHIVMIAFTPTVVTLFLVNRPKLMAFISVLQMLLNIVGDLLVVPGFGAIGAAWVTLVVRISVAVAGSIYLYLQITNNDDYIRKIDLTQ